MSPGLRRRPKQIATCGGCSHAGPVTRAPVQRTRRAPVPGTQRLQAASTAPCAGPDEYDGHGEEKGQPVLAGNRAQRVFSLAPAARAPWRAVRCGGQRLRPPERAARNRRSKTPRQKIRHSRHQPAHGDGGYEGRNCARPGTARCHALEGALARKRRPAPSPARRICRAPATGLPLATWPKGPKRRPEGRRSDARGTAADSDYGRRNAPPEIA